MQHKIRFIVIACALAFFPKINYGQAPDLGAASTFALFTASGAFNGDAATSIVGDIGTNAGAFTPPGFLVGQIHVADPVTAQAAADVGIAYGFLASLTCGSVLTTPLGNSQTLTPNIYCLSTASVLNADLILDAQGDPSAVFVFQIDGALSTNSFSNIILINSANLCNVYWQINGAFNAGGNTLFQGTILAGGAINLANGAILMGRGLSTAGAISTNANSVTLPAACNCTLDIGCPSPNGGTFQCISQIPAGAAADITVNSSCGATSVVISNSATGIGCTASPYILSRTYTVTDDQGHTASCTVTYTAVDNTPPVITCVAQTTPVNCPATPLFNPPTATDACDASVTITSTDGTTPGTCPGTFSTVRTWTATDDCGNTSSCSRTILVQDITPPAITCVTQTTPISCPATPVFNPPTATDDCDVDVAISFSDFTAPGSCPISTTRTWIATDDCGNTSSCSRTILVQDNTLPTIICVAQTTPISCPATPVFNPPTATDACDASVTITSTDGTTPGACPGTFSIVRTWTATDDCGNTSSCSRTILVQDITPPAITCVAQTTPVNCPATPVFNPPTATDACDASVTITSTDATTPGACPGAFSTVRTWTATDDCGNTSSCSRTILVQDITPPLITCPANVIVPCAADIPAFNPAIIVTSDICGSPVTVAFLGDVITNQTCNNRLTITRTYRATDLCGNSANCVQIITVFDNILPVFLNVPPNITIQCGVVEPPVATPTASDGCTGPVTVILTQVQTPGICPVLYTMLNTWNAMDVCGNSASVSQTITVIDTVPPLFIDFPPDVTMTCDLSTNLDAVQAWIDNHGGATATDCSVITWTFTENVFPPGSPLCVDTFQQFMRFIATDECGNSSFQDIALVIIDATPPFFIVPPHNLAIECVEGVNNDAELEEWLENFGNAQVGDACSSVTTGYVFLGEKPGCGNTFVRSYQFWASDDCGNMISDTATFAVTDTTAPVVICPPGNALLTCEFDIPLPGGVTAYDDCGGPVMIMPTIFRYGVGCVYWPLTVSYWYMVTDDCHNMNISCDVSFQVVDSIPPIYNGPDTINVVCVSDLPGPGDVAGILAPYMQDNCYDIICIAQCMAIDDTSSLTYTVKAKDLCANWNDNFTVTFVATGACKPLCTATQMMWGNKEGVINGITTTAAIEAFISTHGGVTAGKLGKTITATSADCIHNMLPGDGNTAQLSPGTYTFGPANNCLPSSPLLNDDGSLKNKLAANVMAMQLNIWYNQVFNERVLGAQKLLNLPYCLISPVVLGKLESNHVTLQGLLDLSNDYLAGVGFFQPGFGNLLNDALDHLNHYWENCQANDPCVTQLRDAGVKGNNLYNMNLAPNPVLDMVSISFESLVDAEMQIRFIGSTSVESIVLAQVVKGFNTLSFSTKDFPPGVYTVVLQHGKDLNTLRMVKVMY